MKQQSSAGVNKRQLFKKGIIHNRQLSTDIYVFFYSVSPQIIIYRLSISSDTKGKLAEKSEWAMVEHNQNKQKLSQKYP